MKYTIEIEPKVLRQVIGLLRMKGMVAAAHALAGAVAVEGPEGYTADPVPATPEGQPS